MSFRVIVEPAEEPLTLAEAKAHMRVSAADDDALITALIVASRNYAESYLRRALITQTIRAYFDFFTPTIELPRPRLISVAAIKYLDTDGALQTVDAADYKVDNYREPCRIVPAFGLVWPSARYEVNAVYVDYDAGYGAAAAVPQDIKQALLLHVGHMYENREEATPVSVSRIPMGYEAIMAKYRVWGFE